MKNFRLVNAAILCMVLFSFFSAGCNKDKSPTKPTIDMALVGNWKMIKWSMISSTESITYTENQLNDMGSVWNFKFNDDGSFEQTANNHGEGEVGTYKGTWKTSGSQLTLKYTSPAGTIIYEYTVSDTILKLTRSSPSGDTVLYIDFRKQ